MSNWRLTLFGDDDVTPLAPATGAVGTCSTDPAHPRPYLLVPDSMAESEIDLAEGTSVIGQVNVRVLDRRTVPGDQATGWLTALLPQRSGVAAGESALNGRRALLEQTDDGSYWFTVMDGVVGGVSLDESLVTYSLELRDIRERERKVRAFVRADTATIFPKGVLGGYGRSEAGMWLIPPTRPLRGRFTATSGNGLQGKVDLSKLWRRTKKPRRAAAYLVVTDQIKEVLKPESEVIQETKLLGKKYKKYRLRYSRARILWRYPGGTWTEIRAPEAEQWSEQGLIETKRARVVELEDQDEDSPVVDAGISVTIAAPSASLMPVSGRDVEVVIGYNGPPSEEYPLHLEGMSAGRLLKDLYDGAYCDRDEDGNLPFAFRIRYDETALLALDTPVRSRITEPVDDLRQWVEENIYKPLGAAPALDEQGRISPVRYALPDESVPLLELNDRNTAPGAEWSHSAGEAVNHVVVKYARDYRVPVEIDPLGERTKGDGLAEVETTIERLNPISMSVLGDKQVTIETILFRAVGGVDGEPVTGELQDETGARIADDRALQMLDRFVYGAQTIHATCLRSETRALRVGDWVTVNLSWLPDYQSGKRGTNRLAQVVSIKDVSPAWRELSLIDAGARHTPLPKPQLAVTGVSTDGVITIDVPGWEVVSGTAIDPAAGAAVSYAISDVQPAADSGQWIPLGRTPVPGTLETTRMPAGARVWIRARAEGAARRPSTYQGPLVVDVPQVARVSDLRLEISTTDGTALLTWIPNRFAAGVRVRYAEHDPNDTAPALTELVDGSGATGVLALPLHVKPGKALTAEVEPWTGWTGSTVAGSAGDRARTTGWLLAAAAHRVQTRIAVEDDGVRGTLVLTVTDPEELVVPNGVGFYVTDGKGVRSPLPVAPDAPASGQPANEYRKTVTLDPEHNVIVEPVLTLTDGSTLQPGSETFDRDRSANIVGRPQVSYDGRQAAVSVTADSDTVALFVQEEVGGALVKPAELGDIQFSTGRRGSFTVTASTDGKRTFRVYGQNADGQPGPYEVVQVDRYELRSPVTAALWTTVDAGGNASLHLRVQGPDSAFPVTAQIHRDTPTGPLLALSGTQTTHTFAHPGEEIGPTTYPGLGGIALPTASAAHWWGELRDAQGLTLASVHASADRDQLPGGSVTPDDYVTRPRLVCEYDDDVTRIVVSIVPPRGSQVPVRTRTFNGPFNGQPVVYTVGDALDGGPVEEPFRLDEGAERGTYRVDYYRDTLALTLFNGPLHGPSSTPPVVEPAVLVDPMERGTVDVYVTVHSPLGERVTVQVKDSDSLDARLWFWVEPGTSTPRYSDGTQPVGPGEEFYDGWERTALFNNQPLYRDKSRTFYVRGVGEQSGIPSGWVPVVLQVKEQPWLDNVLFEWNGSTGALVLAATAGSFCQSAVFEISQDPGMVPGPTDPDPLVVPLTEGETYQVTLAVPPELRGRTWYARVRPFNGPAATGLEGAGSIQQKDVPPTRGTNPPIARITARNQARNRVLVNLTLSGELAPGAPGPLEYRFAQGEEGVEPSWEEWAPMTGTVMRRVYRDEEIDFTVYLEVRDGDGNVGQASLFIMHFPIGIGGDGRIDPRVRLANDEYLLDERSGARQSARAAGTGYRLGAEFEDQEGMTGVPGNRNTTRPTYDATGTTKLLDTGAGQLLNTQLASTVVVDANRSVHKMFAKGLVGDPDSLDGVVEGTSFKRTTVSEKAGAGQAYLGLDASGNVSKGILNGAYVNGSTAGALYRTNVDTLEQVSDGTNYGRTQQAYLDQGRIASVYRGTARVSSTELFRHTVDTLGMIQDGGGYARPLAGYLDAGRVASLYRSTVQVPSAELFRHTVDTLGSIQDGGGYARPLAGYLDMGRVASLYRGTVQVPSAELFRHTVDTLGSIQDGGGYARPLAAYLDTGRVASLYRGTVQVPSTELFRHTVDTLGSIQDGGGYGRTLAGYLDTGRVASLYRGTVQVPSAEMFRHTVDTLGMIQDGGGYARPLAGYLDAGRVASLYRSTVQVPSAELFRHTVDTLGSIQDGGGYARPLAGYLDAGRVASLYRGTVQVPSAELFRHTVDTLGSIQDGGGYGKTLGTYLSGGHITSMYRNGLNLSTTELFRRYENGLHEVTDGGVYRRPRYEYIDFSGNINALLRNTVGTSADLLFRRSENGLHEVVDAGGYAKTLGDYLTYGHITSVNRGGYNIGAGELFRRNENGLHEVVDAGGYAKTLGTYLSGGHIVSVNRGGLVVGASELFRLGVDNADSITETANRKFSTDTEKRGGAKADDALDGTNRLRDHTRIYPVMAANRSYAIEGGTSPITASNSGGYVTISVAAHNIRFAWGTVALTSGSTSGYWTAGSKVHVFAKITNYSGTSNGTSTYYADPDLSVLVDDPNNYYVGYATVPSAGFTGGGGGGGCVAEDAYLLDELLACDARPGDEIDVWMEESGDRVIRTPIQARSEPQEVLCVRLTSPRGASLVVGWNTPLTLRDGSTVRADVADGAMILTDVDGVLEWEALRVERVGRRRVIHFNLGGGTYAAGERPNARIYTHNIVQAIKE